MELDKMEVYLDNSATTRPAPEVIKVINESLQTGWGNPSSLHRQGLAAEKLVKKARNQLAESIGAAENEIIFTSGGTEADNLAIFGVLSSLPRRGNHLITSRIEHPAVLNVFKELERRGYQVTYLNVNSSGWVDLDELKAGLEHKPVLISIMLVNNEIGSIQPISDISQMIADMQPKPFFHVDAVQAFGKMAIDVKKLKVDLLAVSGHKFHGPKGVGALYVRKGIPLAPIIFGGGQETGLRPGTENVPGIAGLGMAASLANARLTENAAEMLSLKRQLLAQIEQNIESYRINSPDQPDFAPHILSVSFPGIKGEVLLHALEQDGIYVATGSACGSKKREPNHVHQAIALSETESQGTLRFSFSAYNNTAEIEYTGEKLKKHLAELHRIMPAR